MRIYLITQETLVFLAMIIYLNFIQWFYQKISLAFRKYMQEPDEWWVRAHFVNFLKWNV